LGKDNGISPAPQFLKKSPYDFNYLVIRYSSMTAAAFLPAPMASITVAPPVTISPPAKTP
jgi:hypothetical protein